MNKTYIEQKKFAKEDFTQSALPNGEYENCTFSNCNFSNVDFSGINFTECEFISCNLGMMKPSKAAMRDVKFKDCKLLGIAFENCNEFTFAVYFENCILNLSSFYKLNLRKTKFIHCSLQEVDFTETDLSNAIFNNCDLTRAIFKNSILDKADLRTSWHYSIDPESNSIKKTKFSREGIIGLLDKYDIEVE